ncbi:MAG: LamG-like jellyroll fold domain-containing protein [Phycisphaerae bacterium]
MCSKFIYLISFVLVLAVVGEASAELVGHWKFDEGSGNIAVDVSGYGNDGTINGATWTTGKFGPALNFDGIDDDVDCGNDESLNITGEITIALWIKPSVAGEGGSNVGPVCKAEAGVDPWSWQLRYNAPGGGNYMGFQFNGDPEGSTWVSVQQDLLPGEWYHIAGTFDGANIVCYLNGVETERDTISGIRGGSGRFFIGQDGWDNIFNGVVDELRIYNHALSAVELLGAMAGEVWPYALGPKPEDGAIYPDTWVNLSWLPGGLAVSHDVYLGDNFDDVDAGTPDSSGFQGNQAETFIVVGFPGFAYPDGLVPGTTYYWRIDEVNDAEPNSPWKGDVWSFSIPPRTAYAPNPADGAEMVDPDVMLSWIGGFGAKLHTVYFGDNFDEVNNAAGGLPQGTATYTPPGTLKLAKTYYWRVDEFDAIETYKGDIWSFTTEGGVGSPDPANGAVDVKHTPVLTWSPGVYAVSHQIYFGTDKEVVRNANTGSPEYKGAGDLGSESFDPGKLEWNTTYYWRIDEANNTNPDSPWTGNVWSFTTANFLVVDDFESYNDLNPEDPESNRIFNAWIDGYGIPTNGSLVGYENPPFAEQTIVHSGNQSMPLFYDNSVGYSEATLTLTYPRDWTENGVTTLSIWFRGNSDNAAETLYVALNGSAVVNHDNPDAAQITTWTEWTINLQAFGVNLANVNTISLGLGNKNNPIAGGSGTMYFDDIRLYPPAP